MTTKIELGLKISQTSAGMKKGPGSCWGLYEKKNSDWKHRNLFSLYLNFWSMLHCQYLPLAYLKADIICRFLWSILVKKMWGLLMAYRTTRCLQQQEDNGKKSPRNWWPFGYSQILLLTDHFVGKQLTSA